VSRRLRARFAKTGKVRFVSHRDVARIWERALRRAGVPIAYTEGFSPRPKLSFGLALSTGYESLGEYLDISLRDGGSPGVDLEQTPTLLTVALPVGMEVQAVVDLEPGMPSLQQAVTSCTWHIELSETEAAVATLVDRALAASELVIARTRKGQEAVEDVRSGILSLRALGPAADGSTVVEAELATQPRGLRPAELARALHPAIEARRVVRIHQWTQVGGARQEVIPLLSVDPDPAREDHPTGPDRSRVATLTRTQQARAS
jgi:radical SAM-linked protein